MEMSSVAEIKDRMDKCQEELKASNDALLQLRQASEKIANDMKMAQSRIDTFSGAVQAFELALKVMEPSVEVVHGEVV
jgi:hypothetical protein